MTDHLLQNAFSEMLKERKLYKALRPVLLMNAWDEIVGDVVAKRTQTTKLENGILQVKVSSHSMMAELELNKQLILEKIQKRFGKKIISDIQFKYGRLSKKNDEFSIEKTVKKDEVSTEIIRKTTTLPPETTKGVRQEILDEIEPAVAKIGAAINLNNKKKTT